MTFGTTFLTLRSRLEITQAEMARQLRVSQSSLCKLERGAYKPTAEVFLRLHRLARARGHCDLFDKFLDPPVHAGQWG